MICPTCGGAGRLLDSCSSEVPEFWRGFNDAAARRPPGEPGEEYLVGYIEETMNRWPDGDPWVSQNPFVWETRTK